MKKTSKEFAHLEKQMPPITNERGLRQQMILDDLVKGDLKLIYMFLIKKSFVKGTKKLKKYRGVA